MVVHSGTQGCPFFFFKVVLLEPPRAVLELPHQELDCSPSVSPQPDLQPVSLGLHFPDASRVGPTPTGRLWGPAQIVRKSLDFRLQGSTFQTEGCAWGLRRGPLGMKLEPKLEHPLTQTVGYVSQKAPRATTVSYPPRPPVATSAGRFAPILGGCSGAAGGSGLGFAEAWNTTRLGTKKVVPAQALLGVFLPRTTFPRGPLGLCGFRTRLAGQCELAGVRMQRTEAFEVASLTGLGRISSDWRERTPEK